MTIEGLRSDLTRSIWKPTLTILGIWTGWLVLASNMPHPLWMNLSLFPLVLLFGTFYWGWFSCFFIVLCMVWIYHIFSIAPPGMLWIAALATYALLKLYTSQFELRSRRQVFLIILLASLHFEILQLFLISRTYESLHLGWKIIPVILGSCGVQALISLLFFKPLLARNKSL